MNSKNPFTIIRIGLALVFLANALAAFFAPEEFTDLIAGSFLPHLLPVMSAEGFLTIVKINDSLIALLLLLNIKHLKYVLIWASIWILGVMVMIAEPLGILEHLGFLSMSIALFLNLEQSEEN